MASTHTLLLVELIECFEENMKAFNGMPFTWEHFSPQERGQWFMEFVSVSVEFIDTDRSEDHWKLIPRFEALGFGRAHERKVIIDAVRSQRRFVRLIGHAIQNHCLGPLTY